jgi:hypothetical protein
MNIIVSTPSEEILDIIRKKFPDKNIIGTDTISGSNNQLFGHQEIINGALNRLQLMKKMYPTESQFIAIEDGIGQFTISSSDRPIVKRSLKTIPKSSNQANFIVLYFILSEFSDKRSHAFSSSIPISVENAVKVLSSRDDHISKVVPNFCNGLSMSDIFDVPLKTIFRF